MHFKPGTKLGPYEIISAVETAKAGELYKASDTRLKREVAIKVFDRRFDDSFVRQARAVGSLNHPNICTLHDVGHEEGVDFLVMEYLEGETLARRLEKGPLGLDEAIRIAIAIGDALDKMHREGIAHRALQPSKVMLTPGGPKLLGIRLAESTPPAGASPVPEGLLPGADLQYTAPECLDGKTPDARSDIFAFGSIVYEMITGRKAFEGKSRAVLIAAIATADPDPLSRTQPAAPPMLEHIVQRCLAKNPEERWQTAHDLLVQLRWLAEGGSAPGSAPASKREKRVRSALAAAVLLIVALAYPAARHWFGSAEAEPFHFGVQVRGLQPANISISPDGETIALVGSPTTDEPLALYTRRTDSVTSTKLAGTDEAAQPFWSPDSRSIGFVAGGRLKQVSVSGGAPKDIGEVKDFSGGSWNQDGTILFGSAKGVYRISAEGGKAVAVTTLDAQETGHFWPCFLPDGQHFLYLAWSGQAASRGVFIGKLDSKDKTKIMAAESNAVYAAPGYIVFHREASVLAQPFNPGKLALSGKEVHLADEVAFQSTNGRGDFDVSQTGSLLYFQSAGVRAAVNTGQDIRMTSNVQWEWVDRAGRPIQAAGEVGSYGSMDLSPDGKLIAVTREESRSSADIWVIDWQRAGVATRLTLDPANDIGPVWAADGKRIAFTTYRKGNADIYVAEYGTGVGKETPLLESANNELVKDWSKDGKYIAYVSRSAERGIYDELGDIYVLPLVDGKPFPVVQGAQNTGPQFSYDGKWLAYLSSRTATDPYSTALESFQLYVRSFPAGDQEIKISTAGAGYPRWRKDGKELYYRDPDWRSIMAVEIKAGARLEAGIPHKLFDTPRSSNPWFAVTPDGQRFLLIVPPVSSAVSGRGGFSGFPGSGIGPVPIVPLVNRGNAAQALTAGRGRSTTRSLSNGLTVIQHWTAALEEGKK